MNEHKAKVLWESEGKMPNGVPFLTVKEALNYYVYAERGGIDSIAFILMDLEKEKFGLIYESRPPLDEYLRTKVMKETAFGGSLDDDTKTPKEICQIEVLEEAGYGVSLDNITEIGSFMVSSQMSQYCHLYIVDVTGLTAGKTESEIYNAEQELKDSDEFKHNKTLWLTKSEIFGLSDWKAITILALYDKRK